MGLSLSKLLSACIVILENKLFSAPADNAQSVVVRTISFDGKGREMTLRTVSFKESDSDMISKSGEIVIEKSLSFKNWEPEKPQLETNVSFKNLVLDSADMCPVSLKGKKEELFHKSKPMISLPEPDLIFSPKPPLSSRDAAAIKLQKVYKSYRTRRNLADCAVVIEELWWKALDFAALKRSSVSFFNIEKPETAVSRWARARTRVAKVGKGLSKDEKAQKLALQHWLEAIDPRHRYGHNLHIYYDVWFDSESAQPFFYWLDVGDGKELNLEKCPRSVLQRQCIKYLGPNEREAYEVTVESGKLVYKQSREFVNTVGGSKWIFVLSTSRSLYVGQKKKGVFQHSSFLAGAATTSAGRLVAHEGVLEAVWPYSGHYLPTEENFAEFISFLLEHNVDLSNVKRCATDEDDPSIGSQLVDSIPSRASSSDLCAKDATKLSEENAIPIVNRGVRTVTNAPKVQVPEFDFSKRLSCKWSTGAGPRIGCVRDYPTELQFQALEHVNLSPRVTPGAYRNAGPIPSPRPSPKVRLSPRLSYMGLPSPRVPIPSPRIPISTA
ncbi:hypothetical protein Scep_007829 [Stephania cephalantha]|uniref:Calmodulin-binding protein n=1 Tax=Stephania cephalantha TaxID=152367 RepID=A0AAP0KDA1_9MAGN